MPPSRDGTQVCVPSDRPRFDSRREQRYLKTLFPVQLFGRGANKGGHPQLSRHHTDPADLRLTTMMSKVCSLADLTL
jgi:hypothetical protein